MSGVTTHAAKRLLVLIGEMYPATRGNAVIEAHLMAVEEEARQAHAEPRQEHETETVWPFEGGERRSYTA